ncbi:alpha/beta fold hydrolase [Brevundimonas sp.]|uniref:alpha/beta fold hydrolase n=1 Tax=Brevundimonas sp. TaxID=1871086 RepID=UPI0035B24937
MRVSRRGLMASLGLVGLGACAPLAVQAPLTPPEDFPGARIDGDVLIMDDGARLPFRVWRGAAEPWGVILGLHGMNDHAMSFHRAGPAWAAMGIETWAYDQRGFGGAPGRGVWAGEARMVQDLRVAASLIRAARPNAILGVAGESMGGAVAISAFASAQPPEAHRAILLAPAVWGWSSQPALYRSALWAAARVAGAFAAEPPDFAVRDIRPTDNIPELRRMSRDPKMIRATRFDTLSGLVDLMESASRDLGRLRVPTLLAYGARDDIIEKRPMALALRRAGDPPSLRTAWYSDGYHILNRDLQAHSVFADAAAFLRDPDAALPSGTGPIPDDLGSR